jgi:hypothetical protein
VERRDGRETVVSAYGLSVLHTFFCSTSIFFLLSSNEGHVQRPFCSCVHRVLSFSSFFTWSVLSNKAAVFLSYTTGLVRCSEPLQASCSSVFSCKVMKTLSSSSSSSSSKGAAHYWCLCRCVHACAYTILYYLSEREDCDCILS